MAAILSIAFIPTQSQAIPAISSTTSAPKATDVAEANTLMTRLDEISLMNKSNMSYSEKRGLHKEVRSIKARLADIGGGVYLSAGAIILIVILLIILL